MCFWAGIAAISLGALAHLPMFYMARHSRYQLAGAPPDGLMIAGMVLIVVGLGVVIYGLFPRMSSLVHQEASRIRVRALDDAPIKPVHVGLLLVMALAVTIDVMKPTTFGFIAPGVAKEYNLKSALNPGGGLPVALYPLAGIGGTVIGSFLWGWLSDRIGRRASILLAASIFIATAVCGVMPNYLWNLATCFVMGLGVGGMLPIIFALMAETIPARHRGWLMVLVGGDVAGAYIIVSWLASTIAAPNRFGWRMLWLIGLPTGLLLLVLNRWIPESPRFLLSRGRDDEARAIMERYGAVVVEGDSELELEKHLKGGFAQLLRAPFAGLTAVVFLLGLGIGMVQFGFQQWIPSNLQKLGLTEVDAGRILRDSALIGFPLNFPIAFLYGYWSGRKTIILMAAVTAAALFGFVIFGDSVAENRTLLYVLLIAPIWGISSLTAVLVVYASEIYPTRVRSRGTGIAAGAAKIGGVMILLLVTLQVAAPSISRTAILGAVPLTLAIVAMIAFGVETNRKQLELITAEEMGSTKSSTVV